MYSVVLFIWQKFGLKVLCYVGLSDKVIDEFMSVITGNSKYKKFQVQEIPGTKNSKYRHL